VTAPIARIETCAIPLREIALMEEHTARASSRRCP
jgi:hypothetical protein